MKNIAFPNIKHRLIVQKPKHEQQYCKHSQLELHPDIRLLLCTKCDLWLDPFDVLVKYSGKAMMLEIELRAMREEKGKLIESVVELRRQERNAKARARNLRKRDLS